MQTPRDTDTEPEDELVIDCDCCSLQFTEACDDCVVSFLLGREPDDAVVLAPGSVSKENCTHSHGKTPPICAQHPD